MRTSLPILFADPTRGRDAAIRLFRAGPLPPNARKSPPMKTLAGLFAAVLALAPTIAARATDEPMSQLTAGPQGTFIPQRELTTRWWCRGMVCVSQLPAEGDVCAGLDPINKGPCHGQDKAHVLRAFDNRQQAEILLVLTSANLCASQLRRWKRDSNLRNLSCEASTPGAFFGVEVSDKD
jgi:hypothetical protein